ncbi:hypothetical protein CVT25_005796 [Psilocybe cyanescens]|uniref:Uncharacterized protein n=1 Tax=Psilocybe cyanescens TaxID=93625 RepID=A0A409VLP0_PSICY|nr:hypothetical protein CVT25_005796 [Psilocybe cyanescens]
MSRSRAVAPLAYAVTPANACASHGAPTFSLPVPQTWIGRSHSRTTDAGNTPPAPVGDSSVFISVDKSLSELYWPPAGSFTSPSEVSAHSGSFEGTAICARSSSDSGTRKKLLFICKGWKISRSTSSLWVIDLSKGGEEEGNRCNSAPMLARPNRANPVLE